MRRFLLFVTGLLSVVPLAFAADTAGLDALNMYVGKWTVKGQEATYLEVCEWMPGHEYLECRSKDRSGAVPEYGTSIFGYSPSEQMYTYFGLGEKTLYLHGAVDGGVWRFFGDSDGAPNWRRRQVMVTPTVKGFHFREEVSDRGGPWHEAVVVDYIRLEQ